MTEVHSLTTSAIFFTSQFVILHYLVNYANADDGIPGSAHAVTSIGLTVIGVSGSDGSKVISIVVPSSPTGISTEPSSFGVTVIGVP